MIRDDLPAQILDNCEASVDSGSVAGVVPHQRDHQIEGSAEMAVAGRLKQRGVAE